MQYIRSKQQGGTYFITVVTFNRRPLFNTERNIEILKEGYFYIKSKHPFTLEAFVLLPDHIHGLLTLPENDSNLSARIMLIKQYFTLHCDPQLKRIHTNSRIKKREQCIWQRRFWEHLIRDDNDFEQHRDYIHYNPVKHNLCLAPKDWRFTSFHQYVRNGIYNLDWVSHSPAIAGSVGVE